MTYDEDETESPFYDDDGFDEKPKRKNDEIEKRGCLYWHPEVKAAFIAGFFAILVALIGLLGTLKTSNGDVLLVVIIENIFTQSTPSPTVSPSTPVTVVTATETETYLPTVETNFTDTPIPITDTLRATQTRDTTTPSASETPCLRISPECMNPPTETATLPN